MCNSKTLLMIVLLLACPPCFGQSGGIIGSDVYAPSGAVVAIVQEATCTGSGTTGLVSCTWSSTPTAGDTLACNTVAVSGGSNLTTNVMDPINGFYDNVFGIVHPASSTSYGTTAVFHNTAAGVTTTWAYASSTPLSRNTLSCYAFKGVPATNALDSGAVNQTASATVTNPTSGTAAAPTNNNEAVVAFMSRSSSTAPSSGGGCWLPAGTLTLVGTSSVRQASEYCLQTTAAAVNGPFTGNGTSIATVDSQYALLNSTNSGNTGGTRALSGFFLPLGAAGSAPTGTITAAGLAGATSFLTSTHTKTAWTQNGATAATYDTTINPTGTRHLMAQGVDHTFGDAGSSVLFAGSTAANNFYQWNDNQGGVGTSMWLSTFYRVASGETSGNICDMLVLDGGVTDQLMTLQAQYTTALGLHFIMEPAENGSSQSMNFSGTLDTDYWVQMKVAGVNERFHQLRISSKSGATWSQVASFNYDVLCSNGNHALCTTPAAVVAPNGTASSGSTALTITSGTSTANGQLVLDNVNNCIPWPTLVEAGGTTTSITLSQATTCPISSTAVSFYTVPAELAVATNGTVSAGSTALTVVAPGTGTITAGQVVGGSGIAPGTTVASVAGTAVTLSLPAKAAMTNGGISFWTANGNGNVVIFGKYSSCNFNTNTWFSAMVYDPFGTWGAFDPNSN